MTSDENFLHILLTKTAHFLSMKLQATTTKHTVRYHNINTYTLPYKVVSHHINQLISETMCNVISLYIGWQTS